MASNKKMHCMVRFTLSLVGLVFFYNDGKAEETNGIQIKQDSHVSLKSKSHDDTFILNIAKSRNTIANVGIASIQVINPDRSRRGIEIRDSSVRTDNRFDGSIINIAKSHDTVSNVGVGQIAVIQPLSGR